MSRTLWKLVNSWWILLTLGFPVYLNWIAFLYIGASARYYRWILYGVIYLIPNVVVLALAPTAPEVVIVDTNSIFGIMFMIQYLAGIISIIHAFSLRNEYLIRLETLSKIRGGDKLRQKIASEYGLAEEISREGPVNNPNITEDESSTFNNGFVNDFPSEAVSTPVDINHAPEDVLAELPGVSLILAKKAAQLRSSGVYFDSAEDFGQALGLKPHQVERIKPLITIKPPTVTHTSTTKGRKVDI